VIRTSQGWKIQKDITGIAPCSAALRTTPTVMIIPGAAATIQDPTATVAVQLTAAAQHTVIRQTEMNGLLNNQESLMAAGAEAATVQAEHVTATPVAVGTKTGQVQRTQSPMKKRHHPHGNENWTLNLHANRWLACIMARSSHCSVAQCGRQPAGCCLGGKFG